MKDIDYVINKAIKGDDKAFEQLIDINKEKLYRMAYIYIKNEASALDIVSDTVYKAYMSIDKLINPNFFSTWLIKILINTAADYIKSKEKVEYISNYEKIETNDFDIEDSIEINISSKIDLYNAIDLLEPEYKNIIILKYFQDMTISQIAKVLDRPEGTIKSYIHRALKKLKIQLKEDYV